MTEEIAANSDSPPTLKGDRKNVSLKSSDAVSVSRIDSSLQKIDEELGVLFGLGSQMSEEHLTKADDTLNKLRGLLTMRKQQPLLIGERLSPPPYNSVRKNHFHSLTINQYKRLHGLEIKDLRRVNIFAGPNNTGKTSLLEAVQILISQNDTSELLRMLCRRGKMEENPPATWIREQLRTPILVAGTFDSGSNNQAKVAISCEVNGEELEDRTFYVASIDIAAEYAGQSSEAITHLFQKRSPITRGPAVRVLCPLVFSSPFSQHDSAELVELQNRSVEAKSKERVISFIRRQLDEKFRNVDAKTWPGSGSFTRLLVTHDDFDTAVDLSQFGEGLQRVYQIGLLFASAKGGVILIDELENAIHHSLLKPFCGLLQELAVEFDAQVFVTSHSKECLDAFMESRVGNDQLSAYALRLEEDRIKAYHYSEARLEQMLEAIDLDLRGSAL